MGDEYESYECCGGISKRKITMRLQIKGPIKLDKTGKEPVSEQLKKMVLEKSKEIKLTVPFQADGKFEKQPLQPDGITPITVDPTGFSKSTGEIKEEIIEEKSESSEQKEKKKTKSKKKKK
jgi:hypothetical protein